MRLDFFFFTKKEKKSNVYFNTENLKSKKNDTNPESV